MNNDAPAGLYIHFPFCKTKCPYCDFFSLTQPITREYLHALTNEIPIYSDCFTGFDTVFLGGGTPSLLNPDDLKNLFLRINNTVSLDPRSEITLEANPDDISPDKIALWNQAGINRISLGIQSFQDAHLKFLQRRHTQRQSRKALSLIRSQNTFTLAVDLMYGLPVQNLNSWEKTLMAVLEYNPDHISCYQLTIHPDTPFGQQLKAGTLKIKCNDDEWEFFKLTSEILLSHGYIQYEVSNFARDESAICRHNLKYWNRSPYLGIGCSAHSFHSNTRWWNGLDIQSYISSIQAGEKFQTGYEVLTEKDLLLEKLSLGFRTRHGVFIEDIHGITHWEMHVSRLVAAGYLIQIGNRLIPSLKGMAVADRLALEFL